MKKQFILAVAAILGILIVGSMLLLIKSNTPGKDGLIQGKELPALYTEGNQIKRADSHESVRLKGVSTMIFNWNLPLNQKFLSVLEKIKTWNINLLGLYITPQYIDSRTADIDFMIDWAEKNRIYIYLMPVESEEKNLTSQLIRIPSDMGKLAERYRNRKNVLFGLWAEPNMRWEQWYPLANGIAKEIKKSNPDAVILFSGAEFARIFDSSEQFPYSNVIYNFHEYRTEDIKGLSSALAEKVTFDWTQFSEQYPVLIGEFGGVWGTGFGEPEDLLFIQKILDEANSNNISYTAYTMDDYPDASVNKRWAGMGGLELINWETLEPTKKGQLIKDDLRNYPPTYFGNY